MGSLNDYNWCELERTHHHNLLKNKLLQQTVLSFVFFLLVATTIGADNLLGDGARDGVVGEGLLHLGGIGTGLDCREVAVVAVLDVRILKKAYGSLFISSLPRCRLAMGALDSICRDVAEFLDNER